MILFSYLNNFLRNLNRWHMCLDYLVLCEKKLNSWKLVLWQNIHILQTLFVINLSRIFLKCIANLFSLLNRIFLMWVHIFLMTQGHLFMHTLSCLSRHQWCLDGLTQNSAPAFSNDSAMLLCCCWPLGVSQECFWLLPL